MWYLPGACVMPMEIYDRTDTDVCIKLWGDALIGDTDMRPTFEGRGGISHRWEDRNHPGPGTMYTLPRAEGDLVFRGVRDPEWGRYTLHLRMSIDRAKELGYLPYNAGCPCGICQGDV